MKLVVMILSLMLLATCSSKPRKDWDSGGRAINSYQEEQYNESQQQTREQFTTPARSSTEQAQPF